MWNRFLERRVEVAYDEGMNSQTQSFELEYYLVESEALPIDPDNEEKVYGLEIIKRIGPKVVEKEGIRNVSACRAYTRGLVGKLADNTVTPASLIYIMDDLLGV